jgi:2-oxoglutarate ferredoxin oxidoreductase subunit beta
MPEAVRFLAKRPALYDWLRVKKRFPNLWCPGCGLGTILGAFTRALMKLEYRKDEVVVVAGIGCTGRIPVYLDSNTLHTTHGRALTFATGIKLAKPHLKVIVFMGDGDALAIGGNHFIHAARRNMDLTAIIINNQNYGMTGGQHSPTTPQGCRTTTTPYGHIENAFSIPDLAIAAGASFVGRSTVYHVNLLDAIIEQALRKKGFSVVEALANCHVQFGRRNNLESPVIMMKWFRDNSIPFEKAKHMTPAAREGKFAIGVLGDFDRPSYSEMYARLCEDKSGASGEGTKNAKEQI